MEIDQIQYKTILKAARDKLEGREPKDVAERSGIKYDSEDKCFTLTSYGQEIKITYPDWSSELESNPWHLAVILQYMGNATGIEAAGDFMPLREYKDGGMIRGASFDSASEKRISESFCKLKTEDIIEAAIKLGGEKVEGKGNLSMVFHFMPYFPVLLNYWEPDDEFPASGRLLCDTTAESFLGVEAAGTAMDLVITYILDLLNSKS